MAAAVVGLAAPAHAAEMTGGQLQAYCSSSDAGHSNFCDGFVYGVVEAMTVVADAKAKVACMPQNVTTGTVVDAVKKTMQVELITFPDDKNLPALAVVGTALKIQYPCQKG
jgi:hypothetical protein